MKINIWKSPNKSTRNWKKYCDNLGIFQITTHLKKNREKANVYNRYSANEISIEHSQHKHTTQNRNQANQNLTIFQNQRKSSNNNKKKGNFSPPYET